VTAAAATSVTTGAPVRAKLVSFVDVPTLTLEAVMAVARVVSFDGVNSDRMAEMQRQMQDAEQPDDVPATEIVVLHDADGERSLVILFFETDDDYRRGDEALNAMPAGDTPGTRTSVAKYDVAFRMTG
jgi:hypothetical protein